MSDRWRSSAFDGMRQSSPIQLDTFSTETAAMTDWADERARVLRTKLRDHNKINAEADGEGFCNGFVYSNVAAHDLLAQALRTARAEGLEIAGLVSDGFVEHARKFPDDACVHMGTARDIGLVIRSLSKEPGNG